MWNPIVYNYCIYNRIEQFNNKNRLWHEPKECVVNWIIENVFESKLVIIFLPNRMKVSDCLQSNKYFQQIKWILMREPIPYDLKEKVLNQHLWHDIWKRARRWNASKSSRAVLFLFTSLRCRCCVELLKDAIKIFQSKSLAGKARMHLKTTKNGDIKPIQWKKFKLK